MNGHTKSVDREILLRAARLAQPADKGKLHSFVRELYCRFHAQIRRPHKASCKERREPPVVLRDLDTTAVLSAKYKRTV